MLTVKQGNEENAMTARTTHFDFDRDSKQTSMFVLIVSTIALFAWVLFAAPANAQDFGPERPTQHSDAALHQMLVADQIAYTKADRAYETLVDANAAYAAAETALNTAIATGVAASSPAEDLGGLAQNVINARTAKEATRAEFDGAATALVAARTAYDAAVATSIPEEATTAEVKLPETDNLVAARIDELESKLLALKSAVCHGHDYDHDHAAAYTTICAEGEQAAETTTEGEVATE